MASFNTCAGKRDIAASQVSCMKMEKFTGFFVRTWRDSFSNTGTGIFYSFLLTDRFQLIAGSLPEPLMGKVDYMHQCSYIFD